MSKIELLLNNLNLREKLLLCFLICLCALFLAFKFYDIFLQDLFQKTLTESNALYLNEMKTELSYLKERKNDLIKEIKIEEEKLNFYTQELKPFSFDENFFIKQMNDLTHNLYLKELKSSFKNEDLFKKNDVFLSLNGDFNDMLAFIQNLENLNPYSIHSVEMDNLKSLNLDLNLKIFFITLKTK